MMQFVTEHYLLIIGVAVLIAGASWATWHLIKSADTFFREANRVEALIRNGADKQEVVRAIYELQKKSFHRQTGSRLTELVKMTEIKYNIDLT